MLPVYIGAYIFILAVLWGFFLIARQHSYKFKHFSKNVEPVTNILLVFLGVLSILGFILLFFLGGDSPKTIQVDKGNIQNTNYY